MNPCYKQGTESLCETIIALLAFYCISTGLHTDILIVYSKHVGALSVHLCICRC